ncbi:MAG: YkgJ family cysteine cluster protein [Acidobacteriaceae bacterium]
MILKPISVPCGKCSACCHKVIVGVSDEDIASGFPYKLRDHGNYKTLERNENNDCIYLVDDKCSIYDNRPNICRAFDCRNTWWHKFASANPGMKERIRFWIDTEQDYTAELEVISPAPTPSIPDDLARLRKASDPDPQAPV